MLEWVPIAFSNAWKWKVKVKSLSRVRLLATPWTAAYQAEIMTSTGNMMVNLTDMASVLMELNSLVGETEFNK